MRKTLAAMSRKTIALHRTFTCIRRGIASDATGRVASKQPFEVSLETEKTYAWCKCGHSNKQPFCDGSHKTTTFKPVRFTVEEKKTAYLCGCKQTGTPPFCDGTHGTESVLNAK